MIDELLVYRLTSVGMLLFAVAFFALTVRFERRRLRYAFLVGAVGMGVGHAMLSAEILTVPNHEGYPILHARFLGYAVWWGAVVYILSVLAGVGRGLLVLLLTSNYGILAMAVAGWHLQEPLSQVTALGMLAFLAIFTILLTKPFTTAARSVEPEQRLLFMKVRNVTLTVWFMLAFVGMASRQNMGLLDAFVGVTLGSYLDLLAIVGIGALLVRNYGSLPRASSDPAPAGDEEPVEEPAPMD